MESSSNGQDSRLSIYESWVQFPVALPNLFVRCGVKHYNVEMS